MFVVGARLSLLVLSITSVLILFELGLRAAGHEPLHSIYSEPWLFWKHDPLLGWVHQPGAQGEFVGPRPWPIEFRAPVSINSVGLRGPEIGAPASDELRVLFLGDSMVAAFEVPYEQTFVALVGQALSEHLGRPVRAINAGVRGYGSDQSYLYYRDRGHTLRPDAVVLFHSRNDRIDNTTVHEMRRPFGKPALELLSDGSLELRGHPVPAYPACSEFQLSESFEIERKDTTLSRWVCRAQMALFDRSALFSFMTISAPWDGPLLRRLYSLGSPRARGSAREADEVSSSGFAETLATAIVLQLSQEVARDGAQLLVMGRPVDFEPLDVDRLEAEGIELVDLEAVWEARPDIHWKHDSHFNPEGHRMVAELVTPPIEAVLRARSPDPAVVRPRGM